MRRTSSGTCESQPRTTRVLMNAIASSNSEYSLSCLSGPLERVEHVHAASAAVATLTAPTRARPAADRAIRGAQVRPGDADSQGLADRGARGGRSDLRGDHPPERLRPARRGRLRAGAGTRDLDDYRTRIDTNAKRNGRPSGKLATNRIIKDARGDRLETIWEFHPDQGGFWREVSVRVIANRQLYTFILNVEDSIYAKVRPAFDALVAATSFTAPNTGADLLAKAVEPLDPARVQVRNRPARRLGARCSRPARWRSSFANGPPHGVWSDNLLVLAHPHRDPDLNELARQLPDQLRREEPSCEVISCQVVAQDKGQALETVVRTQRGPFSMTVIERRFRGDRFDYEVKYTVESKRFDQLVPRFRKSFDSFREFPGEFPAPARRRRPETPRVLNLGTTSVTRRPISGGRSLSAFLIRAAIRRGLQDDEDHQDRRNEVGDVDRPFVAERRAGESEEQGEERADQDHAAGRGHHRLEVGFLADRLVMQVDGPAAAEAAHGRLGQLHGAGAVVQVRGW